MGSKENKKKFELVILKWAYVPAVLIPFFARVFTHVPNKGDFFEEFLQVVPQMTKVAKTEIKERGSNTEASPNDLILCVVFNKKKENNNN